MLNQGHDVGEVWRQLQITQSTLHRGRNQCGGVKTSDAKKLERESLPLKRIAANQMLDIDMLKTDAEGELCP